MGSLLQPLTGVLFLLVCTADAEEIWGGISQEKALTVFHWVSEEFRKYARAKHQQS
jgi:hypothetical protein